MLTALYTRAGKPRDLLLVTSSNATASAMPGLPAKNSPSDQELQIWALMTREGELRRDGLFGNNPGGQLPVMSGLPEAGRCWVYGQC